MATSVNRSQIHANLLLVPEEANINIVTNIVTNSTGETSGLCFIKHSPGICSEVTQLLCTISSSPVTSGTSEVKLPLTLLYNRT